MRKSLITLIGYLLILVVAFVSCSKEEKAKKLVIEHYRLSLHDFSSFEPVQWFSLDTLMSTPYLSDSLYRAKYDEAELLLIDYQETAEDLKSIVDEIEIYTGLSSFSYKIRNLREEARALMKKANKEEEQIDILKALFDSIERNFIPEYIGHKLSLKYRAKTLGGNYKLSSNTFFFDKKITQITEVLSDDDEL